MIFVNELSVSYGAIKALNDVSFAAPSSSITAVLGANGAGKTTLLRTISGLVHPSKGDIRCDETSVVGMATEEIARMGVGHVPEGRGVISEFTVEENLRLGILASRLDVNEGMERQFELFPILGQRRKQYASTLSGGERQMLAMARALIARPHFLLLDEPSLGLAPLVTADVMKTIDSLCNVEDLTVILVEQNARSALRIAHQAIVLHLGAVVASGPAREVANDPDLRHYYLGLVK